MLYYYVLWEINDVGNIVPGVAEIRKSIPTCTSTNVTIPLFQARTPFIPSSGFLTSSSFASFENG